MHTNPTSEIRERSWLYRLAAIAALVILIIIIVQFITFIVAPPPYEGTAADWFRLFQSNPLAGLIDFELFMVIYTVLSLIIAVALFVTLRPSTPSFMTLYLVITLLGVAMFVASRPALEMLRMSRLYAGAATESERIIYLTAGENMIATFNGTAFQVSYLLGSIGGLILSLVMLRTPIFSKATAYVRIASSLCDLGLYVPMVGMYISIFSVFFLFAWHILIAIRLFRLAKAEIVPAGMNAAVNSPAGIS